MSEQPELSSLKCIYSTDELKKANFSYYQINQFVKQNKLKRLNKSYYENVEFSGDRNDFYLVSAFVPEGVICLMSAAVFYNLSTFRAASIDVAIPANKKLSSLPESIEFTLHYFSKTRLTLGVQTQSDGINSFKIYDLEKTVADILSNRNKIGIEETKEIIVNYLSRSDKNINKLYRYAEQLSCLKILKTYLEVLV